MRVIRAMVTSSLNDFLSSGYMGTEDDEPSGLLKETITEENFQKLTKLFRMAIKQS